MNKFFTVNKHNTDAWNEIVYGLIIQGLLHNHPETPYGKCMDIAEEITNILFKALKKSKGWKK